MSKMKNKFNIGDKVHFLDSKGYIENKRICRHFYFNHHPGRIDGSLLFRDENKNYGIIINILEGFDGYKYLVASETISPMDKKLTLLFRENSLKRVQEDVFYKGEVYV